MNKKDQAKVRFSRDGDQFHYLWASRRCLRLLAYDTDLVAVSIEGSSVQEGESTTPAEAGEEVIDVAEYYGSEDLTKARFIQYTQLKHSTQNPNDPWLPSDLEHTIRAFAGRFAQFCNILGGPENVDARVGFSFFSNRPISSNLVETLADVVTGDQSRHPETLEKLKRFVGLDDSRFVPFCKRLTLDGGNPQYQLQRVELTRETFGYLADNDADAPIRLKELVTQKALSESASDPSIRKVDVLRALGATEDELFPVAPLLESADDKVPRVQESSIGSDIVVAQTPVVIHASGGVGKSVLARRIVNVLPPQSVSIVYDCFGNGQYRQRSQPRHRHKDALVQISNELASLTLCDPLIPTPKADATGYVKAFLRRLTQSIANLRAQSEESVLCVVIDAADNAELAAREFGEQHSFARDLLREQLPDGVRLVILCRSERRNLLDLPPGTKELELEPFSLEETASFLRAKYPEASDDDVSEFHRLTARNPRLQAYSISHSLPLQQTLRSLGPNPTSVDAAIAEQLERSLAEITDRALDGEKQNIMLLCTGLAVLKPLVPISVLAAISGVDHSAIRSFAADFGRPLLLVGDALQFRDEPVETWFREKFAATKQELTKFIDILQPMAAGSAYIASCLPFLMLEGGRLTELIAMALDGTALPNDQPIDRREIELQRLQFALRASLRERRYEDATKLAFKAGEETAGHTRQHRLLQQNTDLVAALLEPSNIQEILSRRQFAGEWLGARHVYEAGLLSQITEFKGDARGRLRMAYEWLRNWGRLSDEQRDREPVQDADIAELALARLNLQGPEACAAELRGWSPRTVSFIAGRLIAAKLIDHEKYLEVDALAIAATNDLYLLLAIALEFRAVHKAPPKQVVERAIKLLTKIKPKAGHPGFRLESALLLSVVAMVEAACTYKLRQNDFLASLLASYLPSEPQRALYHRIEERRSSYLSAYTLMAALKNEDLQLIDLAHPELRAHLLDKHKDPDPGDARDFEQQIGEVLPWHKLRAKLIVSKEIGDIQNLITGARSESARASNISYREFSDTPDEIATLWFDILILSDSTSLLQDFQAWIAALSRPLFTTTWNLLARTAARIQPLKSTAEPFCRNVFQLTKDAKEDAESKAYSYINCARALITADKVEANQYFHRAMEVVSKLGDEVFERWDAMMDMADCAGGANSNLSETAYRFSRCAEIAEEYIHDNFDWDGTVASLCCLSPSGAIATISRWRDRNVGWIRRLLPTAVLCLLKGKNISAQAACSLLTFHGEWDYPAVLELCFSTCNSKPARQEILDFALRYLRFAGISHFTWQKLETLAKGNGIDAREVSEMVERAESERIQNPTHASVAPIESTVDWNTIFANLQVQTSAGLCEAYSRVRMRKPPWDIENFVKQTIQRVPTGEECNFIHAISQCSQFSMLLLQDFFKAIPAEWAAKMSIKNSIAQSIQRVFEEHCLEVRGNRRYSPFPIQVASATSGLSEAQLIDVTLTALAARTDGFTAQRLFTLIGLLVTKLSKDEALRSLDFCLKLFEKILTEHDGDGAWSESLSPPNTVDESIAGYIWASLGAPEAGFRWEATHAIRALCTFDQSAIIDDIVRRAKVDDVRAFAAPALEFYRLHARLYLLIGLARVASEKPACLKNHHNLLVHFALYDEPHVVIRHFAAEAAQALHNSGVANYETEVQEKLALVNAIQSFSGSHASDSVQLSNPRPARDSDDRRFSFGLDIESYWFSSLARCLGTSVPVIEDIAEGIICDDWGLDYNGYWNRDERGKRGLYGRNHNNWHSHGSYPKSTDLNFYLSYHSMMVAAGKLHNSALRGEPDDLEDTFQNWLNGHLLTRRDGGWLFDRRDPQPSEQRIWNYKTSDEIWRWSVTNTDFAEVLQGNENRLNVWGTWTHASGRQEQTIDIHSALVSRENSNALLRALQTARSCHAYCIPDYDGDTEIDENGYQLKGWVQDAHHAVELDEFDPWAGNIKYPPLMPAPFVSELLKLRTDPEHRAWHSDLMRTQGAVLWSQVWGEVKNNDDEAVQHGRRLQANHDFLTHLLNETSMDLIIKVSIQRNIRRMSYERRSKDEIEYVEPNCKLFLFRPDGALESLS